MSDYINKARDLADCLVSEITGNTSTNLKHLYWARIEAALVAAFNHGVEVSDGVVQKARSDDSGERDLRSISARIRALKIQATQS